MTALLVTLLAMLGPVAQQESHLSRLVRKEGKSLEFVQRPLTEWQSLDKIVRQSDLIVFARVGTQLGSYVTDAGTDVMTDYHVDVKDVVFSGAGETAGAAISSLTLSQLGGTTPVDGHTVTIKHAPLGLLAPGTDVLLCLNRAGGKYRIVNDYFGVFLVRDGLLTPASPNNFDPSYRKGKPLADLLNEVAAALTKRQK